MRGVPPVGRPRVMRWAAGPTAAASVAGAARRRSAGQVEQMGHVGIGLGSAARRWLPRVGVLGALVVGLLRAVPAGAVPPGQQLAGSDATVVADEDLNVRAGPGLDQPVIATIPPGSHVTIVSGPVAGDGDGTWTWCEHTGWGGQGWSVCQALHLPGEEASVSPAAPAATAPARTTASSTGPASSASAAAASVPSTPPTPTRVPPTPPPMTPVRLPAPGGSAATAPTPAARTGAAGATSPRTGAAATAPSGAAPGGTVNTATGAAVQSGATVNTATGAAVQSGSTGARPAASGAAAIPPPPPGLIPAAPATGGAGSAAVPSPTPLVPTAPAGAGAAPTR